MPIFICPNCGNRSESAERTAGFQTRAKACKRCGFGFLFELLEDYYPGPNTGFVVCDRDRRVIAIGRGVLELTGYREKDVLGHELTEGFALRAENGEDPAAIALEWGVRRLGQQLVMRMRSGTEKRLVCDFFPAYDEDGGLLVALSPS